MPPLLVSLVWLYIVLPPEESLVSASGKELPFSGKEFVTVFMQNCDYEMNTMSQLTILVHAVEGAPSVTISVSVTNFQRQRTLNPGSIASFEIPKEAMLLGTSNTNVRAVRITSDKAITVQSIVSSRMGLDTSIVYPVDYLDREYYVFTPISRPNYFYEFAIVNWNRLNHLMVTFTDKAIFNGVTYAAGSTLDLTLLPFEILQFQSSRDLTGSRVMANQPLAVLSGHQCVQRYADLTSGHVYEQLPPVSQWGKDFIVPPLSMQTGRDLVYIIASGDTNIQVYNGSGQQTSHQLHKGGVLPLDMGVDSMHITADQGILVMFYCTGSLLYQSPFFVPFILTIVPNDQFSLSDIVYAPGNYTNHVVVVTPRDRASDITIHGLNPQVPTQWTSTPTVTSSYAWADLAFRNDASHSYVVDQKGDNKFATYSYRLPDSGDADTYPFAGTLFVTVFLETWNSDLTSRRSELFLRGLTRCTQVCVTVHGTSFQKRFLIHNGEYIRLQIPSSTTLSGTSSSTNSTITISADKDITVLASSSDSTGRDTSIVYPYTFLGTEYYVITPSSPLSFLHEFAIVNLNNNNKVTLSFSGPALCKGMRYQAGHTLDIALRPFESVQIQSNVSLTGSRVTAEGPVAVITGHQGTALETNASPGHVYEHLLPVNQWGNSYIVAPLYNRTETDLVYIMASSPTDVQVFNGSSVDGGRSLIASELLTLEMGFTSLYITANNPVMVLYHCTGSSKDTYRPFLFSIVPTVHFTSFHIIHGLCSQHNRMVIVVHQDNRRNIDMDDTGLPSTVQWNSTSPASAGHVWADLPFSTGPHLIHQAFRKKMIVYPYTVNDFKSMTTYPFSGTQFITAFLESWEPNPSFRRYEMFLHGLTCCTMVSVSVPGTSFQKQFLLGEGEYVYITIPTSVMLSGARNSRKSTVSIISDKKITVLSSSFSFTDRDTSIVYPEEFLGTEYYVITPDRSFPLLSEFAVLNLNYTNNVSITFSGPALFNGVSYAAGQTLNLALSPFESAQIQSNASLTGSRLTADKAVAILTGLQGASWQSYNFYGHIYEQLLPVSGWGNSYIAAPLYNRRQRDLLYIVASKATKVQVFNGSSTAIGKSLTAGESLTLEISSTSLYITANNPVMVLFHCLGSKVDSFASFIFSIIPSELFSSFHILHGAWNGTNRMIIVAQQDHRFGIEKDDAGLPPTMQWNGANSALSGYSWVDMPFEPGPHVIQHSSEERIMVYAYTFTAIGVPRIDDSTGVQTFQSSYKIPRMCTTNSTPPSRFTGRFQAAQSPPEAINCNSCTSAGKSTSASSGTNPPLTSPATVMQSNTLPSKATSSASASSGANGATSQSIPSASTAPITNVLSSHIPPVTSTAMEASTSQPAGIKAMSYLVEKNFSWWEALTHCRNNRSNLLTITDDQAQKRAEELAIRAEGNGLWIGLRRHQVFGNFYWADAKPQSYYNWGDGEPNGSWSELCVQLMLEAGRNFTWRDHCCQARNYFICSSAL